MRFFSRIFNTPVQIKVTRTNETATLPTKAHTSKFADAAYDLYSFAAAPTDPAETIIDVFNPTNFAGDPLNIPVVDVTTFTLSPGERKLVGTGIKLAIPDGYWVKFHERSGLANKGIHILGGVIDSGYTGELKVIMYNSSPNTYSHDTSKAIAQFTVEKVLNTELVLVSNDDIEFETTLRQRGDKGFGSSDGKTN